MTYSLIYDTRMHGPLLACMLPPAEAMYPIYNADRRVLIGDLFGELEKKLPSLSGEMFYRYMTFLAFLQPKIIRYEDVYTEMLHYVRRSASGYIYVANPMGLPKIGIIMEPAIRELVVFNVYQDFKIRHDRKSV